MTEPFCITGPGKYRERGGGVAIVRETVSGEHPWFGICSSGTGRTWRTDGSWGNNGMSPKDLISRIEEPQSLGLTGYVLISHKSGRLAAHLLDITLEQAIAIWGPLGSIVDAATLTTANLARRDEQSTLEPTGSGSDNTSSEETTFENRLNNPGKNDMTDRVEAIARVLTGWLDGKDYERLPRYHEQAERIIAADPYTKRVTELEAQIEWWRSFFGQHGYRDVGIIGATLEQENERLKAELSFVRSDLDEKSKDNRDYLLENERLRGLFREALDWDHPGKFSARHTCGIPPALPDMPNARKMAEELPGRWAAKRERANVRVYDTEVSIAELVAAIDALDARTRGK